MAFFDLSLDELQHYVPPRREPADFDTFWQETLNAVRQYPLDPRFVPVDYGLRTVESFDVMFPFSATISGRHRLLIAFPIRKSSSTARSIATKLKRFSTPLLISMGSTLLYVPMPAPSFQSP
jgi:hypothetical protein